MKAKVHFIIKTILGLLLQMFVIINQVIPKTKNMILIYNTRETYMNNYALFMHIKEKHLNKKYNVIYAMENVDHYISNSEGIQTLNLKFKINYLIVLFFFMKSKYVFYDNSNLRIKPCRDQVIINLWHGTPLKKIGFLSNAVTLLSKNSLNCYSQILISNDVQDEIFIKSFNLKNNQLCHMGYPRNDLLFNKKRQFHNIYSDFGDFEKHIMWMTTYRITLDGISHTNDRGWSNTGIPLLVNEAYLNNLNEFLKNIKTLLIIKMHTNTIQNYSSISFSNIRYLSEGDYLKQELQLYELLPETDALITDYSSIYFDYLILNKPIGFILEDLVSYQEKNGLNYKNILDYMPGDYIYNFDELKAFIFSIGTSNDKNDENRKNTSNIFNKFDAHGKNTDKLLKHLNIT